MAIAPDSTSLTALTDAALRGALVALLLLTATRLVRDRFDATAARIGTALMLCLTVQVIASWPGLEAAPPRAWQAPLVGISVGNSVLFWVFAQALFDDAFVLRRRHVAAWAGVVALGVLFYAVVAMPQRRELDAFALAVAIAMRWTPIVFAALAVLAVASEWRVDLVERRRRWRAFVLVTGTLYTLATAAARIASPDGRLSAGHAGLDIAFLLAIAAPLAVHLLRIGASDLLPPPAPARVAPAAPPDPQADAQPLAATAPDPAPAPDPGETLLAAQLQRLMGEEHAYRTENLTLAALAARLRTPEYRLRRLINQRLGHRNFNAFVNGYRLAEARSALADPELRARAVLTIALDAGFSSIGPFNRAFKAQTGLTPSDYRRAHLADS